VIRLEELKSYDDEDQSGGPLNEEARKLKFRLLGPLGQGHNIVVYICGLASRSEEF
jgi:hypothetical protein